MISPIDIQAKEFAKGMRGYKEEEVDLFLDEISMDMEKLIRENIRLTEEVRDLREKLVSYEKTESTIFTTLESAKMLMNDISVSAEKRAEILMKNAELDADLKIREARENAAKLKEESEALRKRYEDFSYRFKNMLKTELERFDTLSQELFPDFPDFDFGTVSKEERKDYTKTMVNIK